MVAIKRFASIIFVVAAMAASAQSPVDTSTQVFDSSFKSLKVAVEGNDYVAPVVLLGGDSRIRVEFDQISPEMQYLRYSVMHCDADWQPSMLVDSEYVDGFNEAEITDYAYSSGTLVNYVHYALTLPNDDISPTSDTSDIIVSFCSFSFEETLFIIMSTAFSPFEKIS